MTVFGGVTLYEIRGVIDLQKRGNMIRAVGMCRRKIALMPKSVFDLREGEQVSNMSSGEICNYQTMNLSFPFISIK